MKKLKQKTITTVLFACLTLSFIIPIVVATSATGSGDNKVTIEYLIPENLEYTVGENLNIEFKIESATPTQLTLERDLPEEETLVNYPAECEKKEKLLEYGTEPYLACSLETPSTLELIVKYDRLSSNGKLILPYIIVLNADKTEQLTFTKKKIIEMICKLDGNCDTSIGENNRNCPQDCNTDNLDNFCAFENKNIDPDCIKFRIDAVAKKPDKLIISTESPIDAEIESVSEMKEEDIINMNKNFIAEKTQEILQKSVLARVDTSDSFVDGIYTDETEGYTGIATVGHFFKGEGASMIPFFIMMALIVAVSGWFVYKKKFA